MTEDNTNTEAASEDAASTALTWVFLAIIIAAVLWVLAFVVSIPIAKYSDKVGVVEYSSNNGKLELLAHKHFLKEDFLLGMPALAYSVLSDQPDRYYKTAYGDLIDLQSVDDDDVFVINSSNTVIYNDPVTYGDTKMRDDSLIFSIEPKKHKVVLAFWPEHLGCENPPPGSSSSMFLSWTTAVPSDQCP
jgi:hypothetical protein